MSSNLAATTKLKVSQLYPQSFIRLIEKKNMFFIGHKNGIHVYDIGANIIQQVKLDRSQYSGPFSCFTVSDQLIFFCCGSKAIAMSSNLKIVFQLDTYLAIDKIESIHVHGYRLFLMSENMLNQFLIGGLQLMNKKSRITPSPVQKSQDIQEQLFDTKINHSLLLTPQAQKPFLLLLKSSNTIQTFQKKQPEATLQTNSPPTYSCRYPQDLQNQNNVLVGTASGEILYLEVNRTSIKIIWTISQNRGKVNTICQLKNGFFVARDKTIQFWSKNKQLLKQQHVQQKTICSYYLPTQQLLIYGTLNGSVTQMQDYQKFIKQSKHLNQVKQREQIVKEIQLLRYKKSLLQQKLAAKLDVTKQVVSSLKKISVNSSISIDYVDLCYIVELQSDQKMCKIICQGPMSLLGQKQNIYFEGNLDEGKVKVYVLRYQNQNNIQIKVKYQQVFNQLDKLNLLVYFSYELRVHSIQIDLKQLSLHQKVGAKSFDLKNPHLNTLSINGNFKYQIKMWLNTIFNDFSTQQIQQFQTACYESIITKNKILVKFKPGHCLLSSDSVIPLLIIKKKLLQKSKERNLSLSFDTFTNPESIKEFISNIQAKMRDFIQTKRKYELLPGLLQLKNQLSLQFNQDLFLILQQRQSISSKYKQNARLQSQIRQKIIDLYRSFKTLNNRTIIDYQQKAISNAIQKWDTKTIVSNICG